MKNTFLVPAEVQGYILQPCLCQERFPSFEPLRAVLQAALSSNSERLDLAPT